MVEQCFVSVQPVRQTQVELSGELKDDIAGLYADSGTPVYAQYSDVVLTLDERIRIRSFLDGLENLQDAAKEEFYDRMGVLFIKTKLKQNIAAKFGEMFVEIPAKQRPVLKIGNSSPLQPSGRTDILQPNLINRCLKPATQTEKTNIYEHEKHFTEKKEVSAIVPNEIFTLVTEDTNNALNNDTPGTILVKPGDIVVEHVKGNVSEETGMTDLKERKYENSLLTGSSGNTIVKFAPTLMQQNITPSVEHTHSSNTDSSFSNDIRQPSAPNISIRTRKRGTARSNTAEPPCKRQTLQALEKKLRPGLQKLHESQPEQIIRKSQNGSLLPCFDKLLC